MCLLYSFRKDLYTVKKFSKSVIRSQRFPNEPKCFLLVWSMSNDVGSGFHIHFSSQYSFWMTSSHLFLFVFHPIYKKHFITNQVKQSMNAKHKSFTRHKKKPLSNSIFLYVSSVTSLCVQLNSRLTSTIPLTAFVDTVRSLRHSCVVFAHAL